MSFIANDLYARSAERATSYLIASTNLSIKN